MKDICAAPGSRPLAGYCQRDGQRPLHSVRRRSLSLGLVTLIAVKELFEALTGANPKVGMRGTAATALPRGTFAIPTTASPPREIAVSTLSSRSRRDCQRSRCSGCCRSPPALELTVSDTLQSFGLALGGATSGRLQGYC